MKYEINVWVIGILLYNVCVFWRGGFIYDRSGTIDNQMGNRGQDRTTSPVTRSAAAPHVWNTVTAKSSNIWEWFLMTWWPNIWIFVWSVLCVLWDIIDTLLEILIFYEFVTHVTRIASLEKLNYNKVEAAFNKKQLP